MSDGVSKNTEKGLSYLRSAASKENSWAKVALAALKVEGQILPQDKKGGMQQLTTMAEAGEPTAHTS